MEKRTVRFELLLTPTEAAALRKLAELQGVSMANVVAGMIRRTAARQKIK